jgi:hypothetical protein
MTQTAIRALRMPSMRDSLQPARLKLANTETRCLPIIGNLTYTYNIADVSQASAEPSSVGMAPRVLHRIKPCTWAWERICYVIIDRNPGGHDRDSSRPSCSTGVCQRRLPSEIVLSRISLMISSPRTMILSQLSQSVSSLSTTS